MDRRRSAVLLSALAAMTSLLVGPACRKRASDSLDAATGSADASTTDGGAATLDGGASAATAATATATAATTGSATSLALLQPPPTPFTGTYRCFAGMKLEQAGRIVTSTMHKGTTDTVLACTAGADICTGTVREIETVRGKPPKVLHVKPVTLQLTPRGDVLFVVASPEKKPGRGDHTFCARR